MSDNRPKCPNTPKYPCGGCPVCQVPPAAPHRPWSWPPGFHEAWPTQTAIASHQGGTGRWLVTDPYGVKTLGTFDGDTFHVLMRWHVAGEFATAPGQPWRFEPYAGERDGIAYQREKRDVEHEVAAMGLHETTLGGLHSQDEVESIYPAGWRELLRRHYERAPAPPAASDSPGQPQDPTLPESPAAEPGIAPGLDAAGFRSWPSEEEIEAHGNGLWLIRQKGEMAPGQIRSMVLGRFGKEEGRTVWWSGGHPSYQEHMSAWTFCPIDDNGDKLDAAPVLRGEDARRLVESLGQVAPPEEIARRREDARRRLAESEAAAGRLAVERMTARQARVAGISGLLRARAEDEARRSAENTPQGSELEFLQNEANRALDLRPLTKADRCPRCDEYVVPCPKCPLTSAQLAVGLWPSQWTPHRATCKYVGLLDGKACACNLTECVAASPLVTESLGSGVEAPAFKDEHVQMALDARELAAVKAELALTTQSLVDVTNKLNEATLRIRDLKAAVRNEDKYAVPVGPAGFENDRIGRVDHTARILATLPDRSPDRRVLVVLRGLPGSGKSTVAQAIVDSDPGRWARVSKDDVRQMMVGPSGDLFRHVEDRAREVVVAKTAEEMTMSALRLGLDVVVDATNLTDRALGAWRMAAMVVNRDGRGPVLVCERAVPTPVEECVARDARRGARSVGRAVIERLAATIDVPLADRDQEVS